jgi:hypothetical protein
MTQAAMQEILHCDDRELTDYKQYLERKSGKDLSTMLPILAAYLGHADLRCTQHYLRLTAEMYPNIASDMDMRFGDLIPTEVTYE